MDAVSVVQQANLQCMETKRKREACYAFHGTKDTENCLIEELQEKRCLAFQICPANAEAFYGSIQGIVGKAQCSLWAEAFAFRSADGTVTQEEVTRHQTARDIVTKSTKMHKECRAITMDLAKCLAKYPIGQI